jgi:hypothetical protein
MLWVQGKISWIEPAFVSVYVGEEMSTALIRKLRPPSKSCGLETIVQVGVSARGILGVL